MFEILLAGGRGYYPQSGPGNKIMIDGNIDLGYFGTVSSAELFKSSELLLKTGLSFAGIIAENVEWLKFAYKGKFLFVAKQPVKTGISWDVLYEKGLVYGLEGFGPGKTVGTDQLKVLDKEGFLFKVRLMRGANTDPFVFSTTSYSTSETIGSEWNDLLYRVSKKTTNPSLPKWEKFDNVQLGVDYYSMVQELSTSGHAFIRGASGVDYSTVTGTSTTSSSFGWRPVLEVIDPKGYLFRAESVAYKTEYMWAVGGIEHDLGWGDDANQIPLKSPYGFEYTGESLEPVIRMTGSGDSFIRPIGDQCWNTFPKSSHRSGIVGGSFDPPTMPSVFFQTIFALAQVTWLRDLTERRQCHAPTKVSGLTCLHRTVRGLSATRTTMSTMLSFDLFH